jgi:hypothetical protein
MHWEGRAEHNGLLVSVMGLLAPPKDIIEQDHWAFIVCYLAVMLWEYRYCPKDCDSLLQELIHQCECLRPAATLADIAWLLVQGLDRNQHRKWQINCVIRVLHRLSNSLGLKIGRFLYGLVNPRQPLDVFLDMTDFETIRREAFAGLSFG